MRMWIWMIGIRGVISVQRNQGGKNSVHGDVWDQVLVQTWHSQLWILFTPAHFVTITFTPVYILAHENVWGQVLVQTWHSQLWILFTPAHFCHHYVHTFHILTHTAVRMSHLHWCEYWSHLLSETGKLRNFITPMLFNINKMVFSAYYSYLAIKFRI